MKKIILIFLLLQINIPILSQSLEDVIDDLYADNIWQPPSAISYIIEYDLVEAMDILPELYDEKPPIVQITFLEAFLYFEDPSTQELLLDFIERADGFVNEEFPLDPLQQKVAATYYLFAIDDYSTYGYVFDIINRDGLENSGPIAFNSLSLIMNNMPLAEIQAKNSLIEIWDNSLNSHNKYFSMLALVEKYGTEMISRIINTFNTDDHLPSRSLALEYLFEFEYSGLNLLLKVQLIQDPSWSFRVDLADSLLIKFGEPSDLKAVIDYQPTEPDETTRSLMGFSIQEFIPPRPTVSTSEMIDNLQSFTQELLQYGWITEYSVYNLYQNKLSVIEEAYNKQKVNALCILLDDFLSYTEGLSRILLTIEGYKFMHYHGTYIKENVESEFGPCPQI